MLVTVMASVSIGGAYVTDLFVVQRLPMFFNQNQKGGRAGYQILLALSTQMIGYSCAGMTRRFLVYPQQMIWPQNLAAIALNKALHHDDGRITQPVSGPLGRLWSMSRHKFMLIAMSAMFVYFWFPDYIFQALSYTSWITWMVNLCGAISTCHAYMSRLQNLCSWQSLLAVNLDLVSIHGPHSIGISPLPCLNQLLHHFSQQSILLSVCLCSASL